MKTLTPSVYPAGTVRALLKTDQVTEATRQALTERLKTPPHQPTFFSADEFALLTAICDRLIPQDGRSERIDTVSSIDQRLAGNKTNGWRYDSMPADGEAYKRGLQGIQESAQAMFGQYFEALSETQRDLVLKGVQSAEAPGPIWQTMPANRFFEELLAEATESYYSHPLAQEEIGYVGMADVPAWQRIGLNQLEHREPREIANPD
ncbi:gluconate 2-dehydrogenase subunit 3 family protein [Spirosoma taeanense]|uniref:Gluconate 2-dehydrogenase subunit 3 family protein n=1 Tax=Spirosoma taeanense TaxID=2735870 RepID=A0A6M5YDL5_9BACT|nr:gluconate 2-dehydrogenase subunit 3 family protein [Spirosoma taeanense]QJW92107.1 gluconate 2-dehydrogenase subunit 3 family protein [Spirosoma taeanense]